MNQDRFAPNAQVTGTDGVTVGTLVTTDQGSDPDSIVIAHARDGRHVRIPFEQIHLDASTPERIVVDLPGDALLRSDAFGSAGEPAGHEAPELGAAESLTIPLAAEELVAAPREVEQGRVLVRKRVETAPEEVTIAVAHDEVDVERVPVDREIDTVPQVRHEGETMVVPVVEEVLVVEKRLRLVEEVRITTRRVSEERTIREDVRREVVEIDTRSADSAPDR